MRMKVKVGGYSIWLFLTVAQNFSFRFNLGKQTWKSLKESEILEAPGSLNNCLEWKCYHYSYLHLKRVGVGAGKGRICTPTTGLVTVGLRRSRK